MSPYDENVPHINMINCIYNTTMSPYDENVPIMAP